MCRNLMSAHLVNQGPATLIAQEAQWSEFFGGAEVGSTTASAAKSLINCCSGLKTTFVARNDTSNLLHFRKKFLGFGQFIEKIDN